MPYIDADDYLKQYLANSPDVEILDDGEGARSSRQREELEASAASVKASLSGAHSQAKGAWGEGIAKILLEEKGILMVEQIATPIRIIGSTTLSGKTYYDIVWGEKVSGDWRGIMPNGRRVLAEAKARDHNLRWSDLQEHQIKALDENHQHGGISLLVYIHPDARVVMRWPIPTFGPRKSIKPERARGLEWDPTQ